MIFSAANSFTAAEMTSFGFDNTGTNFSLPTSAVIVSWNATIFLISSCPNKIASSITSSGSSFAPASTIITASFEPATVKFRSDFSLCSTVGFTTNFLSIRPIRTPAIGPLNGISDTHNAQDAPIIAANSGALSCSKLKTVAIICTSFRKPSGNNGRIGRSINLAHKIPDSCGLPSRLINPPGIFPPAYIFSSKSTVNGKKSAPSRGSFDAVAQTKTTVSPYRTSTAPFACLAILPFSMTSLRPPRSISNVLKLFSRVCKIVASLRLKI